MDLSNTPVKGTGSAEQATAPSIDLLLASENATSQQVVDNTEAEPVADEVSNTTESENVEDVEQPETDSDEVDNEDTEEVQDEAEESEENGLSDDTLVDVQGEQVTLKELREGYMRRADYTKKRQAESAELKQHMDRYQVQEKDKAVLRGELEQNLQIMAASIAHTFQMTEAPDDDLRQIDFPAWQDQMMRYAKEQKAIKEIWDAGEVLKANKAKHQAEQLHFAQVAMIEEFGGKYPEFADTAKVRPLMNELGTFLLDQGFNEDEIGNMADGRMLDIVYRLYKHEVIAKQVPKVLDAIKQKPPISGSGTATVKAQKKSAVDTAIAKMKRTGSHDAENDVFAALLKNDR
ncbi:hypothetical protein [Rhizobium sp. Leaf262]|uniref:hypothetical protein n=1 Tax=Rhizobium sp. Leaf262 TaxID=1736312 RepID=UPI0007148081|nr:hypothetical protein [Rhizobium sp. Leaf262]KQO79441.1 hypothetical protein ASF29_23310 [Rhizobium sp. Leaf262]